MRIGMILDAPFPDDARVSNECDELIKRGHKIFLFCLSYCLLYTSPSPRD